MQSMIGYQTTALLDEHWARERNAKFKYNFQLYSVKGALQKYQIF